MKKLVAAIKQIYDELFSGQILKTDNNKDIIKRFFFGRRMLIIFAVLLFSSLNISCNDDFNPKSDFINTYTLNCFVQVSLHAGGNGYATNITATVGKTYDIDGYIPSGVQNNKLVRGANINIYLRLNKDYTKKTGLGDSLIFHLTEPERDTVIKYSYYRVVSGFTDSYVGNENLELVGLMPDGTVLNSTIKVPRQMPFDLNRAFNHGLTTVINTLEDHPNLTISWEDDFSSDYLYFPKMIIYADVPDSNKSLSIEVPCQYVNRPNGSVPLYPGDVRTSSVSFSFAAIDSAMKNISRGYIDKSKIRTLNCRFSLTTFERSLAAYYTSTHGYMDSYSVRTDENIYSNIIGGHGIFGASFSYSEAVGIDKNYAHSFGYKSSFD